MAILGRPNVGKSTLFNRYAGRRRAIVEDTPGLTRDRIVEEVEVAGRRVLIVDTAGLEPEASAGLPASVQAQARAASQEADAILFLVDGKAGLLPADEAIAEELRRTAKPLVLAVNKIDTPAHEERALDFHRLGFERVRAISAEHARGAWDALEELVAALPPTAESGPEPEAAEELGYRVALVGRPNVGKSSLLNRLVGQERVVVSEEPGTTRDAVDVRLEHDGETYVFVDTAGLRRPGRRDRVGERASALMTIRAVERAEVALVLVDASEGFTDQDARVAGLVRERGCATAVLVNKWDLASPGDAARKIRSEIDRRLRFMADAPILTLSAKTGLRVERVFPLVAELAAATRRRIPTAELNRWLQEAVSAHEPAMAQRGPRRRPLKFFYATQTGARPPSFVLFCTEPKAVQDSYLRYLEKRLRERFGLEGAPLRLRLRARREVR